VFNLHLVLNCGVAMHIQAGKHIVTDSNPAFQPFKDGDGNRHFDHVVKFDQKFDSAPQVLVALNHVDVGPEVKLQVAAENITASGFVLRYSTWADARVLSVGAQWIAFHAALSDMTLTGKLFDPNSD
jgi:H-type lectin domain